ncbi:hypothetical protein ACHZ98_35410 [Streptomyces sp. MAR4 CNY-716]
MPVTATRIHVGEALVTVTSSTEEVTNWSRRYFGPWWQAFQVPAESTCAGALVVADVDADAYADRARLIDAIPHESATYARDQMLVATDAEGVVAAYSPAQRLAYSSDPRAGRVTITGCDTREVALAAARVARDLVRVALLRTGWSVLHASAVVKDRRTVLAFGSKGAGKSTTALLLAARSGWELLANDRVFARHDSNGGVQLLPWPSAAAIGLGLLDSLGLYDTVTERLDRGEQLHPTQDQRVSDALEARHRAPLWDGSRELKAQVWPHQFPHWFGINLATGGTAAALVFPQIMADAAPDVSNGTRTVSEGDFMRGQTEDRYPDVLGLAGGIDGGGRPEERDRVARLLAELPHHSVVLGHDTEAAAAFLDKLTAV